MAGSQEKVFATVSREAAEAFASERLVGSFDSSGKVAKASAGGVADCIVLKDLDAGEFGGCVTDGLPVLGAAGGTIAIDDELAVDSSAKLIAATKVSEIRVGIATSTGAAGGLVEFIPWFRKGQARKGADAVTVLSASGAVTIPTENTSFVITKATAAALTLADPTTLTHDGLIVEFVSTTAAAHTIDNSAGSGFNAAGAGGDVCTFSAAIGNSLRLMAYGGKWLVLNNINGTMG